MRVISLVPSLTETLIECRVKVVGRTRFCIHPEEKVKSISVVGGTKSVNWKTCESLKPDLVVLDREENTVEIAESCPFPWIATHITSLDSVASELGKIALRVESEELRRLAAGWQDISASPPFDFQNWDQLPGLISLFGDQEPATSRVEYIIWRDPWMAIGTNTFIHSVLQKVGLHELLANHSERYPELHQHDMQHADTFYLFSSEPFPFARYTDELRQMGIRGALVDGEFYSWFGVRSYRFLKQCLRV